MPCSKLCGSFRNFTMCFIIVVVFLQNKIQWSTSCIRGCERNPQLHHTKDIQMISGNCFILLSFSECILVKTRVLLYENVPSTQIYWIVSSLSRSVYWRTTICYGYRLCGVSCRDIQTGRGSGPLSNMSPEFHNTVCWNSPSLWVFT